MASRRVAKSAVDWAAFAKQVPKSQTDAYRAFKAKSDIFVSRVHRFPENLPSIDFAAYKKVLSPAFVESFEKAYASYQVPYPKDPDNIKASVDAEEKQTVDQNKTVVADIQKRIGDAQAFLDKVNSVPSLNKMTNQMYADYFPDQARNPWDKPTIWPHTPFHQPGNDENEIK